MNPRRLLALVVPILLASPIPGLSQTKVDPKAGKAKYDANCVGCHGATGKGDGAAAAGKPWIQRIAPMLAAASRRRTRQV